MWNYRWPERDAEQNKELPNQHKNTELAGEWQNRHSYCRIDTYNGKICTFKIWFVVVDLGPRAPVGRK